MDDFVLPGVEHLDAATSLLGLGAVELDQPTLDIDGDGTLDSATLHLDDAMVVATDVDHDGLADHLTVVDSDGEFAQWEYSEELDGTGHWRQVDHGRLGD